MYSERVAAVNASLSSEESRVNGRSPRVLPLLEPFYYLKNFELMLTTIRPLKHGELLRCPLSDPS